MAKPIVSSFRIMGKPWQIRVLDKKQYSKKRHKNSVALTRAHLRCIELSHLGCDLETVVHELVHAYLYELCTHSADLTVDAQEEIFCELMAKRGKELLALADTLVSRLQRCHTIP